MIILKNSDLSATNLQVNNLGQNKMDKSVITIQSSMQLPDYTSHNVTFIWANDSNLYIRVDNTVVAKIKGYISIMPN